MKKGYKFNNSGMELTCVDFYGSERKNVGLFLRKSDGMYITARDTSLDENGMYSWAWGHYFTSLKAAGDDFQSRITELKRYE